MRPRRQPIRRRKRLNIFDIRLRSKIRRTGSRQTRLLRPPMSSLLSAMNLNLTRLVSDVDVDSQFRQDTEAAVQKSVQLAARTALQYESDIEKHTAFNCGLISFQLASTRCKGGIRAGRLLVRGYPHEALVTVPRTPPPICPCNRHVIDTHGDHMPPARSTPAARRMPLRRSCAALAAHPAPDTRSRTDVARRRRNKSKSRHSHIRRKGPSCPLDLPPPSHNTRSGWGL